MTRKGGCAQYCGYLDFTYQHTESTCVKTTEVLDIRPGISHPPKLDLFVYITNLQKHISQGSIKLDLVVYY